MSDKTKKIWVRTYRIADEYVEPLIKLYEATHTITKKHKGKKVGDSLK